MKRVLRVPFFLVVLVASGNARPSSDGSSLAQDYVRSQGLRRVVRFYQPDRLADRPALVIALHGSGGDGERVRRLIGHAFERLADDHGFLVAYPDAIAGQWKGCRARAPYRSALAGIDDIGFLRTVVEEAERRAGRDLAGVFLVGYSNGGHLAFRAALEAPRKFAAFAVIGAHLPVVEERDCASSETAVSIFVVSGTEDPVNPFAGGAVRAPGGETLGRVVSAEDTARFFRELAGAPGEPAVDRHPDRDRDDGTRVETRRWVGERHEVVLMIVRGGGHTLPHPFAPFPPQVVGRTSRDLDGAAAIWSFFRRHGKPK